MDIDDITDLDCAKALYSQTPSKKGSSSDTNRWMIMKKGKAFSLSKISNSRGVMKEYVCDSAIEANKKLLRTLKKISFLDLQFFVSISMYKQNILYLALLHN